LRHEPPWNEELVHFVINKAHGVIGACTLVVPVAHIDCNLAADELGTETSRHYSSLFMYAQMQQLGPCEIQGTVSEIQG